MKAVLHRLVSSRRQKSLRIGKEGMPKRGSESVLSAAYRGTPGNSVSPGTGGSDALKEVSSKKRTTKTHTLERVAHTGVPGSSVYPGIRG